MFENLSWLIIYQTLRFSKVVPRSKSFGSIFMLSTRSVLGIKYPDADSIVVQFGWRLMQGVLLLDDMHYLTIKKAKIAEKLPWCNSRLKKIPTSVFIDACSPAGDVTWPHSKSQIFAGSNTGRRSHDEIKAGSQCFHVPAGVRYLSNCPQLKSFPYQYVKIKCTDISIY